MSAESIGKDDLLSKARIGDPDALAGLMQAYEGYLRLIARLQVKQHLQGRVSPSDVVQDVFLRVKQYFSEFRGTTEAEFMAWLRRILASRLASLARHHLATCRDVRLELRIDQGVDQSSCALENCFATHAESPSQNAQNREQAVFVAQVLDELSVDYREVLVQRHFEGKSFAEIAQAMNKTIPSVKSIWTRAVTKLRIRLTQEDAS